jgi:sigma-70-like protein
VTVPGLTRARPQRARPEPSEPGEEASLFQQYLSQIAATPLLTADEEVELAKQIEAGVSPAPASCPNRIGPTWISLPPKGNGPSAA